MSVDYHKITREEIVLANCPARTHNTMHVARPGWRNGRKPIRCICPGADRLRAEYRRDDLARKSAQKTGFKTESSDWERGSRLPFNYTGGACTTPWGAKIAEGGFSRSEAAKELAREQCRDCPLLIACTTYTLIEEADSPGMLGGIYGGLDAYERGKVKR